MFQKLCNFSVNICRRVDWRAWVVLAALAVTLVVTLIIYALKLGRDPSTFFGAIFAAWVGGVALFVVLGAVVAIVSLAPPENAPFDSRARILFRRQSGRHINYIINRIGRILEHYAESCVVTIIIDRYHVDCRKYRTCVLQDTVIRSYIDDIDSTYVTQLEYEEVTLPPPGGESNRLVYVRINEIGIEGATDFGDKIHMPIRTTVSGKKPTLASFNLECWMMADTETSQLSCTSIRSYLGYTFRII